MPQDAISYYSSDTLRDLQNNGVVIPAPEHVFITQDVPLNQIASGVVLYPSCRISGKNTHLHQEAVIGLRGPVCIENSTVGTQAVIGNLGPVTLNQTIVGPKTVLGSGVAEQAVFLGKETQVNEFTTGFGFRTRKGSLYEEDVSTAQYTDTKMTILFPWVTLGSNINFCDTLLAGGTGPELGNFSEVGSGTVHFNFTLRGDKATASLLGNVPNGVFLKEDRLFIGGNNSFIGPILGDFGAYTAAGIRVSGKLKPGLNLGKGFPTGNTDYNPQVYSRAKKIIGQQINFVGQLTALYHWYQKVRCPLATNLELRELYQAGGKIIELNIHERIKHIEHYVESLEGSIKILSEQPLPPKQTIEEQKTLLLHWPHLKEHLLLYEDHIWEVPVLLTQGLEESASKFSPQYTKVIQNLSNDSIESGIAWLSSIVYRCEHFFHHEVFPKE
ncbi:hypothetical protein WDW89_15510 [Deltaproteobacteria bacterium TL4]